MEESQKITSETNNEQVFFGREKLQISELTELETIFNASHDAMFIVRVCGDEFRYTRSNAAYRELTGLSLEDIKDKTPEEVMGRETGAAITAYLRRCFEAKVPISFEETLKFPAGERVWLTNITPVIDKGEVKYLLGSRKDISLQKKAEKEKEFLSLEREAYRSQLIQEKELLRVTLESIGDGVVTTDHLGRITFLNKVAEEITCWKHEEAYGREFVTVFKLYNEETGILLGEDPVAKVIRQGRIVGLANHTVLETREGNMVPIADSAAPIRTEKGEMFGVVMVFRDVSDDKEHKQHILYLSYYDSLTGLYNRRFMEDEIKKWDTSGEVPISVIMGDLNGLKVTNDVFGHSAGDQLLIKAAQRLRESCRKEDIVARWGGDEFLILLPNTSLDTAEKILKEIKTKCKYEMDGPLQVSIALGMAQKTDNNTSLFQVIHEAEEWMYRNKLLERKSYRNALMNTLVAALYENSMETQEHADRLKNHCLAMGMELNLSIKELDQIELLTMLHDVGKVGISERILQKPGPLIPEEWEQIKKHPEIGFRIAQHIPELVQVSEYILSHHERWDGKGYPQGLKGSKIPLLARMLAVADAYDAMTNDRTYRKAMSREEAIQEIIRNSGTQFDPQMVQIFLKIA